MENSHDRGAIPGEPLYEAELVGRGIERHRAHSIAYARPMWAAGKKLHRLRVAEAVLRHARNQRAARGSRQPLRVLAVRESRPAPTRRQGSRRSSSARGDPDDGDPDPPDVEALRALIERELPDDWRARAAGNGPAAEAAAWTADVATVRLAAVRAEERAVRIGRTVGSAT
jgi:hypothetical protein